MNLLERRAVIGLTLVYALRMFGMFMILPVFALYAQQLPGAVKAWQIGLAIGIYGLAQALLQIPLGMLSDRIGRKPVIAGGMLVFALGSFIAGASDDIGWIIFGRAVQGMGAVSSAASALLADVTRDSVRTAAMTLLGMGIGASFILALVLGPVVAGWIGVDGIFQATAISALLAIPLVQWWVPDAPRASAAAGGLSVVLGDNVLLRLNGGIFLLHACMTALFMAAPLALAGTLQLEADQHWQVYLPVVLLSLLPVFPMIRLAERGGRPQPVFLGAIALLAVALLLAADGHARPVELVAALLMYFIAFNYLEGALPSRVSRQAPPAQRGAALGLYGTSQFLGGFFGSSVGGYALGHWGIGGVFASAALLPVIWLTFAYQAGVLHDAARRTH